MPVAPEPFKQALSTWPSGVTVVTTRAGESWHGMTASAFASVSAEPPLVLVCVNKTAEMHGHLESSGGFVVNILATDQKDASNWFAGYRPDGVEEPAILVDWAPHGDAPVLHGALTVLDCVHSQAVDAGSHTVFIGQVEDVRLAEEGAEPLLYAARSYRSLGPGL